MQAPDQKTKTTPPWGVVVLVAMIAMVSCVGMIELARRVAAIAPRVGDIIAFSTTRQVARDIEARVIAARPGQSNCTLDAAVMRQAGGSLIVEERQPGRNPIFRAHWSGLRTSADADNCGAAADLVLRASDLEILAIGAGGYGVVPQLLLP